MIITALSGRKKKSIISVVINLSPEICRKLKEARREKGLSQSVLAREVGCKQSALSMFEQGDGTKLNDEVVRKLAAKFGIELTERQEGEVAPPPAPVMAKFVMSEPAKPPRGFCPNPHCPSNHAYQVEEKVLYRPNREEADPIGGKYCAICGELLERRCPNCGAPVHDGAICSICGEPYVAAL